MMQDRPILQSDLPQGMQGDRRLPGVAPLSWYDWILVDTAYNAQMALRRELIDRKRAEVYAALPEAEAAIGEFCNLIYSKLAVHPRYDLRADGDLICPDGARISMQRNAPLLALGRAVQQDFCIMQKQGAVHHLVAAILCFPASWRLSDKMGRSLWDIHDPVTEYDEQLAKRVQRIMDAMRPEQPLWRSNWLHYKEADLFQPNRRSAGADPLPYLRAERQSFVKLPKSGAVVFGIHTHVLPSG